MDYKGVFIHYELRNCRKALIEDDSTAAHFNIKPEGFAFCIKVLNFAQKCIERMSTICIYNFRRPEVFYKVTEILRCGLDVLGSSPVVLSC